MQYVPAAILWALALIKLPNVKDALSRHVFWAALFAAAACTLYIPALYADADSVLGGHNMAKLITLVALMLGFWQFRSAIVVAVATDERRCWRRLVMGRFAVFISGSIAISGFMVSHPGPTSANLQHVYADEPGMKLFLVSGSAFLFWVSADLMVVCLKSWRHLRSPAFRIGFLLVGLGCAAACLAVADRVLYGSISTALSPTTLFTAALDSSYWALEGIAVTCIGVGLLVPSIGRPVHGLLLNLEARALLFKLRPAWQRTTEFNDEIVLHPSTSEFLTPLKPNAKMHLHRRFIEINDGQIRSRYRAKTLPSERALLDRAESLLSRR